MMDDVISSPLKSLQREHKLLKKRCSKAEASLTDSREKLRRQDVEVGDTKVRERLCSQPGGDLVVKPHVMVWSGGGDRARSRDWRRCW